MGLRAVGFWSLILLDLAWAMARETTPKEDHELGVGQK